MQELIHLREENTKTFDLGGGKRRLEAHIGAIHYRDNYADPTEAWKDIDLTWEGNRITKAPYELTRDGNKLTFKDKKTGEVSTLELTSVKPAGIPFEVIPEFSAVRFQHILPNDKVPFEAKFKVTGKAPITRAFDDEGGLELEASLVDGVLTEKLSQVKDKQTGQVRPAKGQIKIDPTWQVGASSDDCRRTLGSSDVWQLTTQTVQVAGSGSAAYIKSGGGMRFANVTIPQGSTIENGTHLTLRANYSLSGTTVNTRISAEDVDDAPTFADDKAVFDTRYGTHTTAVVAWDSISAWTANSDYDSPEIKTVIQEIVDRAGWASGNDIVIFWEDFDDRSSATVYRFAYPYEVSTTYAPKLVILYTEPVVVTPTTLALTLTTYIPTITIPNVPSVRIAFSSDPFDASPVWSDITGDCISLYIKRGRQHELNRFEAGTATLLLKNMSGNYYSNNIGGDYYPNVKVGKRISIRKSYDGTVYNLYDGFIESWNPTWLGTGGTGAVMQIECADLIRILARLPLNDAVGYSEELSGTRIGNVLDDVSWIAGARDIDDGQQSMQATGALVNVIAQTHILNVCESEISLFYIAGDGDAQYEDRSHRTSSPHDTPQATFGVGVDESRYTDINFSLDDKLLYNEIRATRESGTEQSATDSTSQTAYGHRGLVHSGLLLTTDNITKTHCLYLLARYANPIARVTNIVINPADNPTDLWAKALGYEISTRITVNLAEASIDAGYFIEGIQHSYDARENNWITRWELSDADHYLYTPDPTEETVRPTGAGTTTQLTPSAGANWACVDEVTKDDDTTYVENNDAPVSFELDTYETGNIEYTTCTINSVTVYAWCKGENDTGAIPDVKIAVRSAGTNYYGTETELTTSYALYSKAWTTDPATGVAWTVAAVQAMEIGVALQIGVVALQAKYARCTQVYAVVNYTPAW